jgi:hypothetical protein
MDGPPVQPAWSDGPSKQPGGGLSIAHLQRPAARRRPVTRRIIAPTVQRARTNGPPDGCSVGSVPTLVHDPADRPLIAAAGPLDTAGRSRLSPPSGPRRAPSGENAQVIDLGIRRWRSWRYPQPGRPELCRHVPHGRTDDSDVGRCGTRLHPPPQRVIPARPTSRSTGRSRRQPTREASSTTQIQRAAAAPSASLDTRPAQASSS